LPRAATATAPDAWWRGGVIYQIYPRSFLDASGDGVGDLAGIARKLDHVASLGVDAIWIAPFFASPMKDFGYDVSDYCAVDPLFGTLADFDRVVARAHALGLKVIIDQVWSHTSDQHAWFAESRSSRDNAKADWYVWADPKPDGAPPNNWLSVFGGGAWTWEPRRRQYYLHHFLASQPQLDLYNEEVIGALSNVARFWLDRGVDGFRLDAIDFMFHDPMLRDNPPREPLPNPPPTRPFGMQQHVYDMLQPQTLAFMSRLRAVMRDYPGTATLGEVSSEDGAFARLASYTDSGEERLDMAYTLALMKGQLTPHRLRHVLRESAAAIGSGCICWAFSNHDVVRAVSRWSNGAPAPHFARFLMALLLTLPGSACLYQGEELGLTEATIAPEDMRDPYGLAFYPAFAGRDGCRTPMPWTSGAAHGGFSTARPWLPLPAEHLASAVDRQSADADSLLNAYRRLLAWRRTQPALRHGHLTLPDVPAPLLAIIRGRGEDRVLAVFNWDNAPVSVPRTALPNFAPLDAPGFAVEVTPELVIFPPHGVLFGKF
jgi:alpha-glucosidase